MKTYLELEEEMNKNNICASCFKKTLKIVLSNKIFKEIKNAKK